MICDAVLIKREYGLDAVGNQVSTAARTEATVEVKSIGYREFYAAAQAGHRCDIQISLFWMDYDGQEEVELLNKTYAVVRTYTDFEQERVELYLEEKAGVTNA